MEAHQKQVDTQTAEQKALNDRANAEGTTPERIQQRQSSGEQQVVPGTRHGRPLVDGYAVTEGENYATPQRDELEGYDPAHSGVRSAKNQPGKPTETPGRDEGTAWSSQEQNGSVRDTFDKKNPAQ
ncbi:hypothetical protein [Dictyobacter arantiisoli]|uniref:Uncharacterized protein n=1 Tax=Dictyobacter arantiisoli TaxID=2014874 RepID=A0A5A5TBE5_9CHLR|nr:hypothetical protein [Dictyobacter arantiisoli]GCF08810.1 hypothetical protein KDI_23740 [Dictyobacter arantiisoli]